MKVWKILTGHLSSPVENAFGFITLLCPNGRSPVLVFVDRSVCQTRYWSSSWPNLLSMPISPNNNCLPSSRARWPKCFVIIHHTVLWSDNGPPTPKNPLVNKKSSSSFEMGRVAFGLFPFPNFVNSFRLDARTFLHLEKMGSSRRLNFEPRFSRTLCNEFLIEVSVSGSYSLPFVDMALIKNWQRILSSCSPSIFSMSRFSPQNFL